MPKKKIAILVTVAAIISFSLFLIIDYFSAPDPLHWENGARQSYEFLYDSTLRLGAENGTSSSSVTISGTLNFRIFSVDHDFIYAGFQFSPVSVLFSGKRITAIEDIYSQLFTVKFLKTGQIITYTFPNAISTEDEAMIKDLLSNFILQLSERRKRVWRAEQENSTGTFSAEFRASEAGIRKQKQNYLLLKRRITADKTGIEATDAADAEVLASNIFFEYGRPSSWIRSARGSEQERFRLPNNSEVLSTTRFHLKTAVPPIDIKIAIWDDLLSYESFNSDIQKSISVKETHSFWEKENRKYLENRYSNETVESVFDDFLSEKTARWADKVFISDYLKLHPDKAQVILNMLLSKELTVSQQAGLIHILELADTAESQETLILIINTAQISHDNRLRAVAALSGIDHPTESTVRQLTDIYDSAKKDNDPEISGTSMLALGNLSRTLSDPDRGEDSQALSKDIKSKIVEELDKGNADTAVLLLSVENTHDQTLEPYAAQNLTSESPDVRSAAASVYRAMDDETAINALIPAISAETNSSVKESMINTLLTKMATEDSFQKMYELSKVESSDSTRRMMVRYLVENRDKANSGSIFKEMLRTEMSPSTRVLIYRAIHSKGNLSRESAE